MSMCYVALRPCGCLAGAAVDEPGNKKATAQAVKRWIERGLVIERRTVEQVRGDSIPRQCTTCKPPGAVGGAQLVIT
jgi:hypothetical protein